jgi:glycosyltransferase involved in cell wall biosynthesis
MKVLMLCMEFPPVNTTGNYRNAGFARYFSKSGIDTVVLTCDVESGQKTFNRKADKILLEGLEDVKIYRFPIKPLRYFWTKGFANSLRIWWKTTDKIDKRWYFGENMKSIDALIVKERPDVIYVSLPPFSMARTALKIAKKFKIPLVTDMRDAWSLWVTSTFQTRLHYRKIYHLEKAIFTSSSVIIGVTPELINDFKNQHREIPSDKFETIYNGYDDLDIKDLPAENIDKSIFKIGYVGSFYYDPKSETTKTIKWYKRKGLKKFYYTPRKEEWIYRSPYFFLKSLSELLTTDKILKHKIYFEYIGNSPIWLIDMIKEFSLENNFINHGFKSKMEVLQIQSGWDAVLATSEKVINGNHFCLPSKIFDSVALGKRIFAFVTLGSQYDFLKNYSQVTFFNPDLTVENVSKLKVNINNEVNNFKIDKLLEEFNRDNQSKRLFDILTNLQV